MGMKDPLPTFTALVERIRAKHPKFAYLHVIEPRINGIFDLEVTDENRVQSNEPLRKIWGDAPYIAAGGMNGDKAASTVEKYGGLVAFGRHFLANVSLAFGGQLSRFSDHIAARSSSSPEGRSPSDAV